MLLWVLINSVITRSDVAISFLHYTTTNIFVEIWQFIKFWWSRLRSYLIFGQIANKLFFYLFYITYTIWPIDMKFCMQVICGGVDVCVYFPGLICFIFGHIEKKLFCHILVLLNIFYQFPFWQQINVALPNSHFLADKQEIL